MSAKVLRLVFLWWAIPIILLVMLVVSAIGDGVGGGGMPYEAKPANPKLEEIFGWCAMALSWILGYE